jgi:hypothetical protein
LQHQNKSTATSEQGDCNNKTKLLQREMQYQKKETNATKKYYLLQYQNKATTTTEQSAMRESNIRKKTNATKKYYLLQYQNKATTTTEQSAMRESNIRKKLMQQRNITCYDIRTRLLQCEIQHQK